MSASKRQSERVVEVDGNAIGFTFRVGEITVEALYMPAEWPFYAMRNLGDFMCAASARAAIIAEHEKRPA